MEISQYQIILVNLDPAVGSEMKKTRPCVVISPNEMNQHLQTIVIAPLTSSSKSYPTRVIVNHNKTKSWIVLDQIRTIDKQRISKILDQLTERDVQKTKSVIKEMFVD